MLLLARAWYARRGYARCPQEAIQAHIERVQEEIREQEVRAPTGRHRARRARSHHAPSALRTSHRMCARRAQAEVQKAEGSARAQVSAKAEQLRQHLSSEARMKYCAVLVPRKQPQRTFAWHTKMERTPVQARRARARALWCGSLVLLCDLA